MSSCCYSFDDLFRAAHRRDMSAAERAAFDAASQPEKNRIVRDWVLATRGGFACEDRRGTDGVIYTAFWGTAPVAQS